MKDTCEQNRQVILALFERSADGEDVMALFDDELVWRVPGTWVVSGEYRKNELPAFFDRVFEIMKAPPVFTIHHVLCDGNCVAVDATSQGQFKDGTRFSADYHFLFVLREGLITQVKEHLDSEYMNRMLSPRLLRE